MLLNRPRHKDATNIQDLRSTPGKPQTSSTSSVKTPSANKTWAGDYLQDLRSNRPARPQGARQPPPRNDTKVSRSSVDILGRATSAMGLYELSGSTKQEIPERAASAMSLRQETARGPRTMAGTPLARPPMRHVSGVTTDTAQTTETKSSTGSKDSNGQPYKIPYYERGQRWMEKQEMSSLRRALEDKDLHEEQRLFEAAQDEAADLVWKHQNPGIPYTNPDKRDKQDYRSHLRQGSHARTLSNTPYENLFVRKGGTEGSRSASDGSDGSHRTVSDGSQGSTGSKSGRFSSLSFSMRSSRIFGRVGSRKNRHSDQGLFSNPNDKIYEVAADVVETKQDLNRPLPLQVKPRNISYGTKSTKDKITMIEEKSETSTPIKSIVEIHKNPPSQSRNAQYRINKDLLNMEDPFYTRPPPDTPNCRVDREIRGDDIRAATSMSLKDRSPKLPMPTVVSDRPGRPIVSFNQEYRPRRKELQHERSESDSFLLRPVAPLSSASMGDVPTIQVDDTFTVPTISLPDEKPSTSRTQSLPTFSFDDHSQDVPTISVSPSTPSINLPDQKRALPQPTKRASPFSRSLPSQDLHHSGRSAAHWSPSAPKGTAQCSACALPIAGKIVSAAGKRFHPHCFSCFCCGELLECVAFYPEPDKFRAQRLARIQARMDGYAIPEDQLQFTEEEDGDDGLRFYCHLDFHEKFSPRCKNCKTPIEGQVIVACGAEWHVGHFFCAECGDPFEANMPFVEKNGYAWCVNCHTKRFSGKCAGCRKPITDLVVSALGKEWHEECFKCKECNGDFEDGKFFTRGEEEIPVCVKCEERRLKA